MQHKGWRESVASRLLNYRKMQLHAIRQKVLVETLTKLYDKDERDRLRKVALDNVEKWRKEKTKNSQGSLLLHVVPDDWGVAALEATKTHGEVFACLNMANQQVFGGGYVDGMVAQEENMFRRTDCHFSHPRNLKESQEVSVEKYNIKRVYYTPSEAILVESLSGECYFDTTPRVCIRGQEDRAAPDLGYKLLKEDEIFPFYELRSAATDLRGKSNEIKGKQKERTRKKVKAQLDTLIKNGVRHAILSAFGCGAFLHNAYEVATVYKEEIEKCKSSFDVIIFAVYYAGYGNDNFKPFQEVFSENE